MGPGVCRANAKSSRSGEQDLVWNEPDTATRAGILEEAHLPVFERHVFVCHNVRPEGAPRPSCTANGTSELHARLQQLAKEAGLAGKVRINKSGCLDQCEHGPTVVVYPEAVWYGHVKPEDAAEIVSEHLIAGRPVERLRLADECVNTKSCPHRA
jgi:(2Fe-2S) ferredoxin